MTEDGGRKTEVRGQMSEVQRSDPPKDGFAVANIGFQISAFQPFSLQEF